MSSTHQNTSVDLNAPSTLDVPVQGNQEPRRMGVYAIKTGQSVQNLSRGRMVGVHVHSSDGPVYCGRISMHGLTAFVPGVARALREHKDNGGESIKDVVFPDNTPGAVSKLIGWIKSCISAGNVVPFLRIRKNAYQSYSEIKKIAEELSIGYLIKSMEHKMVAMDDARRAREAGAEDDDAVTGPGETAEREQGGVP